MTSPAAIGTHRTNCTAIGGRLPTVAPAASEVCNAGTLAAAPWTRKPPAGDAHAASEVCSAGTLAAAPGPAGRPPKERERGQRGMHRRNPRRRPTSARAARRTTGPRPAGFAAQEPPPPPQERDPTAGDCAEPRPHHRTPATRYRAYFFSDSQRLRRPGHRTGRRTRNHLRARRTGPGAIWPTIAAGPIALPSVRRLCAQTTVRPMLHPRDTSTEVHAVVAACPELQTRSYGPGTGATAPRQLHCLLSTPGTLQRRSAGWGQRTRSFTRPRPGTPFRRGRASLAPGLRPGCPQEPQRDLHDAAGGCHKAHGRSGPPVGPQRVRGDRLLLGCPPQDGDAAVLVGVLGGCGGTCAAPRATASSSSRGWQTLPA